MSDFARAMPPKPEPTSENTTSRDNHIPPMDAQTARILGVAGENGFVADGSFQDGEQFERAAADEPTREPTPPC